MIRPAREKRCLTLIIQFYPSYSELGYTVLGRLGDLLVLYENPHEFHILMLTAYDCHSWPAFEKVHVYFVVQDITHVMLTFYPDWLTRSLPYDTRVEVSSTECISPPPRLYGSTQKKIICAKR